MIKFIAIMWFGYFIIDIYSLFVNFNANSVAKLAVATVGLSIYATVWLIKDYLK